MMMNSALSSSKALSADQVVEVFNGLFLRGYHRTCLQGAAPEPLYEPAEGDDPARIWFRDDYLSSALHEIAHWCIAGAGRRALIDYGYWYDPDGRSDEAQTRFMIAEARPQALEWCLSQASGVAFSLSLDNLDAPPDSTMIRAFADAVVEQALSLAAQGLPPRAEKIFTALGVASGTRLSLPALRFSVDELL